MLDGARRPRCGVGRRKRGHQAAGERTESPLVDGVVEAAVADVTGQNGAFLAGGDGQRRCSGVVFATLGGGVTFSSRTTEHPGQDTHVLAAEVVRRLGVPQMCRQCDLKVADLAVDSAMMPTAARVVAANAAVTAEGAASCSARSTAAISSARASRLRCRPALLRADRIFDRLRCAASAGVGARPRTARASRSCRSSNASSAVGCTANAQACASSCCVQPRAGSGVLGRGP